MDNPKRWWLTPCGLDCSKCSIHLRTEQELDYWRKQNIDPEKIRCDGCRADRSAHHWSPECQILQCCVYERKLEFCAQCPDFPCKVLDKWGQEHEHHAKAVKRLATMKDAGIEEWLIDHGCS